MGRINGLGVYEPPSAKPFPIVHKKKASSSSAAPSLPSIHWTELPTQPKLQPPQRPSFLKHFSRPETSAAKKQRGLPPRIHQSLKKLGTELIKDHASGHVKSNSSRTSLQDSYVVSSPGSVITGYAGMYVLYAVGDTKCTGPASYAYLKPLGTCIANMDGSGLMYTADVS